MIKSNIVHGVNAGEFMLWLLRVEVNDNEIQTCVYESGCRKDFFPGKGQ